jgi:hypothetical protein
VSRPRDLFAALILLPATFLGALWLGGDLYFTSGPGTHKSHNLAAHPIGTIFTRRKWFPLYKFSGGSVFEDQYFQMTFKILSCFLSRGG